MQDISYTVSPTLANELANIDKKRDNLLVVLLSRNSEQLARWDVNSARTSEIQKLAGINSKKNAELEGFSNAYFYIDKLWYSNHEKVTVRDIKTILKVLNANKRIDDSECASYLDFIQSSSEHPLVQSGIALFLGYKLKGISKDIVIAVILSSIFLYKGGYDMRGMLNLENFFASDRDNFLRMLSTDADNALSSFLEYYIMAISIQSEKSLTKLISYKNQALNSDTLFKLGSRDIQIMVLFDKPGVKVTNKTIQKNFHISQITASRDLARLAKLGLIVRRGKGRSVYYTKL